MASGRGDAAGERRRRSTAMARDERGRFVRAAKPGEEPEGRDGRRATKAAAGSTGSEGPSEGATKAMATPVKMPELGESITEGTITRWLKQEGDRVEADEPLYEISTDKVDTEVPSPVAGVLQSIKVQADETVQVGAELAVIGTGGARKAAAPKARPAGKAEAEEGAAAEAEQAPAPKRREAKPAAARAGAGAPRARMGDGKAAVVSPLVRRLAREHDIDLSKVEGSGSGGRVRREDVEAYLAGRGKEPAARPAAAAAAPPAAGPRVAVPLAKGLREEVVPATRLRRLIAERMVASLQTSAQLTSAVEVDMTNVMRLRQRAKDAFKQREGVSLSPLPFCILALVAAVRQ